MSVFKVPNTPYYYYEFQIDGEKFRGSTRRKNRKEAVEVEREIKAKVEADLNTQRLYGKTPLLWIDVANRYWEEKGQHSGNHKGVWHALELLTAFFGKTKRLDEITGNDVARLITWRREQQTKTRGAKPVSAATVNRLVESFRTVRNYALAVWGCPLPQQPNWKAMKLKEVRPPPRELSSNEEGQLFDTARPDYERWLHFALASGRRLAETLPKWSDVKWEAGVIVTKGKGGRDIVTMLSPAILDILEACQGHHPEFVFTYQAVRANKGRGVARGARVPLTYAGVKSEWQAHRKRHKVVGFRIHDLRADHVSKVNRIAGLTIASKAANHANPSVTAKHYAHTANAEVGAAQQRVAENRVRVLRKSLRPENQIETKPMFKNTK